MIKQKIDKNANNINNEVDLLWNEFKLKPEILFKAKVLESSVYLTRRCNLKCQYCKIVKTELPDELSMDRWIEAMDVFESLGVRFVNIAGGEPTILKELPRLISHITKKTTMAHSLVSNSLFGETMLRGLVEAGLQAYVASIDVDDTAGSKEDDIIKAGAGIRMLEKLRAQNVPYLCANIVISAKNLANVVRVTETLSNKGIWVNLCPVIWGRGDKWEEVEEADNDYRLTRKHTDRLQKIAEELIALKKSGALILPTEQYLQDLPVYGTNLSWKCFSETTPSAPTRLIVDADGALLTCINMRGKVTDKYSIFDLKKEGLYEQFSTDWYDDAKSCKGCYWSTMVTAKERNNMLQVFKKEVLKGHEAKR